MTVTEAFTITNRGTGAVGDFQGVARAGDRAVLRVGASRTIVDRVSFEMLDYVDASGRRCGRLGILLYDQPAYAVPIGAVIESED